MAAVPVGEIPSEGAELTSHLHPLPRSFYGRSSVEVAPDLLGRLLVRRLPGSTLIARIVECEAYMEGDPASHSYRGPTGRTEVMFGPPGHLYVYFTYGNHWCMNVVTGNDGDGSAVLLRAAEPLEGIEVMRARRGRQALLDLCSGPGKLTQALGVNGAQNGADLVKGDELILSPGEPISADRIAVTPRIGLSVAIHVPWRFVESGSRFLSRTVTPVGGTPAKKASVREKARGKRASSAS